MHPVKELPDGYVEYAALDLTQNKRTAVLLNVVSLPLIFVWGWLFIYIAQHLNPAMMIELATSQMNLLLTILFWLVAIVVVIVLHELVHGLFFWLFTGQRAVFGFNGYFAYAGAPGWYLPKWQYSVVCLSPLIVITLAGIILLPFTTALLGSSLLIAMAMNAGGSIVDLLVALWLLGQPATSLGHDTGLAFTFYRQEP